MGKEKTPELYYLFSFLPTQPNTLKKIILSNCSPKFFLDSISPLNKYILPYFLSFLRSNTPLLSLSLIPHISCDLIFLSSSSFHNKPPFLFVYTCHYKHLRHSLQNPSFFFRALISFGDEEFDTKDSKVDTLLLNVNKEK